MGTQQFFLMGVPEKTADLALGIDTVEARSGGRVPEANVAVCCATAARQ
jgi:hypothetical protein